MTTTSTTTDDKHLTPDEEFEAHIAAHPHDLTARGAYADYLDERGDPRAAEHRLHIALQDVLASPYDDAPRLAWAAVAELYAGSGSCERCGGDGSLIGDPKCESCSGAGRVADPDSEYTDGTMDCPDCDRIDCPTCDGTGSVSNGLAERAEFIRVQCEIARLKTEPVEDSGESLAEAITTVGQWGARLDALRRREQELWSPPLNRAMIREFQPLGLAALVLPEMAHPDAETYKAWGVVRRGFVDEIRFTLAAFVGGVCEFCSGRGHFQTSGSYGECPRCLSPKWKGTGRTPGLAAAVFRATPTVTRVVTDREPYLSPEAGYVWLRPADRGDHEHTIPDDLYDLLPSTPANSRGHLNLALSAALVAYGREAAAKA